jgi:hypothetical protein
MISAAVAICDRLLPWATNPRERHCGSSARTYFGYMYVHKSCRPSSGLLCWEEATEFLTQHDLVSGTEFAVEVASAASRVVGHDLRTDTCNQSIVTAVLLSGVSAR